VYIVFLVQYKDKIELLDGFQPPIKEVSVRDYIIIMIIGNIIQISLIIKLF